MAVRPAADGSYYYFESTSIMYSKTVVFNKKGVVDTVSTANPIYNILIHFLVCLNPLLRLRLCSGSNIVLGPRVGHGTAWNFCIHPYTVSCKVKFSFFLISVFSKIKMTLVAECL